MSDLLRDYVRKRGRAMLHFKALRDSVERVTDVDVDRIRGEFDPNRSKYVFNIPTVIDPDWSLLTGEFVYNTRASLDYLITALVRSTGNEENDRNEFPIYGIKSDVGWMGMGEWWDTSKYVGRQLENTPSETRAALKQLQPFNGVPVTNPSFHPLWALYRMSNRDKHRRLNLLATTTAATFIDGYGKPIFPQMPTVDIRIPERDKGEAYTVTLDVRRDYPKVDMYLLTAHDVSLHEPPELIGDLIQTLTGINQFIDGRVLPTIRALL